MIGRGGIASMGAAAIAAAASGYLVLIIVARSLPPATNANFLVFWSLLFAVFGVLGGVQQEGTRAVGTVELARRAGVVHDGAHVLPWLVGTGAALLAVVAGASPWWSGALLEDHYSRTAVVALCVGALAFTGHLSMVGALAGRRRWSMSAVLIGGESLLRLAIVALVAALGASLAGLEIAVTASTAFWLATMLVSPTLREVARTRADVPGPRLAARAAQAMAAAVGSAALVVGFPTLLRLSSSAGEWSTAAPLLLAISLTRAPLLIPLNAFQGVAISYLIGSGGRRAAALVRVVGVIVVAGLVASGVAGLVGPPVMAVFFGPDYRVSGLLLGALTLAAVTLAILTLTGAGTLALAQHRFYAAGWLTASAVSVGLLFVPLDLAARALLSLAVGPLAGVAVHMVGLRTGGLRHPAQSAHEVAG